MIHNYYLVPKKLAEIIDIDGKRYKTKKGLYVCDNKDFAMLKGLDKKKIGNFDLDSLEKVDLFEALSLIKQNNNTL